MAKEGKKKDKAAEPKSTTKNTGGDYGLEGPSSGGSFTPEEHENKLLLIAPQSLETGIKTSFGEKDAIKADIVILDESDPTDSEEINGGLIFPAALQGQLTRALGKRSRVVGRLYKNMAAQKAGQKPPWMLAAPTDSDIEAAKAYLDAKTRGLFAGAE